MENFGACTRLFAVACCSVRCAKRIRSTATCSLSISSLAQASFDIRLCQVLLIALCCDWFAMSSYVFQFFCGPEGIALANPGAARARPALAGPPQRPAAELVFTHPGRPPAPRLRSASASAEPERPRRARRSPSGHRRRHRMIETGGTTTTIIADQGAEHHARSQGGQQRLHRTDLQGSGKRRHKGHSCQLLYCAPWHVSGTCSSFSAQTNSSATVSACTGHSSPSKLENAIPPSTRAATSAARKTAAATQAQAACTATGASRK